MKIFFIWDCFYFLNAYFCILIQYDFFDELNIAIMKGKVVLFILLSAGLIFTPVSKSYCQNNKKGNKQLSADFQASAYEIVAGDCINFTDMSTGGPTYWEWQFPGSETLSSNLKNPAGICYLVPGVYSVTLEIQSSTGYDQKIVEECITVLENTQTPVANFAADNVIIPKGGFVTFTNLSQGDLIRWNWEFEGGTPDISTAENPMAIAYMEIGTYDVYLQVEDAIGQKSEILREDYIQVVSESTTHPIANFTANRTFIAPGEAVNFTDLSKGRPYKWTWSFDGGEPDSSTEKDPQNILYQAAGTYDVQLIIQNSLGTDTILKEDYIIVSETDPCTTAPIAKFSASQRLIPSGTTVHFEDKSLNNPTQWYWSFQGGYPSTSYFSNPPGIEYNFPEGRYDVTLTVSNECGADYLTKPDYIVVYSGAVSIICDTISNIAENELAGLGLMSLEDSWGHIGGHNGQITRMYADKFDTHVFTQIEGIQVPVHIAQISSAPESYNARVNFYIWDGSTQYPEIVLHQKDIYIRNMSAPIYNFFKFENPVEVDGPFFVGYRISYNDVTGNGQSDDLFVVSVAQNRTYTGAKNTLYVQHSGVWQTATERFNVRTSTGIKPIACLVDVKEFETDLDIAVYPNPASSFIKINTGVLNKDTNINIQIFDITGRLMYQKDTKTGYDDITINTENYQNGLYLINVISDNSRFTEKIMILH